MNAGNGRGEGRRKLIGGRPSSGRKDRDEDLLLFREMHKREKDRIVSLLQPVSEEFESNGGNYPLYKLANSARKGSGYEFAAQAEKNDYDWLKTPPATPLFPSLEMEATGLAPASDFVLQREMPTIHHRTSFSGNNEATKTSNTGRCKSSHPNPNPKFSSRSTLSMPEMKTMAKCKPSPNQSTIDLVKRPNLTKPTKQREERAPSNLLVKADKEAKAKPGSRGVSPAVMRPTSIPAQTLLGFSDQTPPNLRTDRSSSTSRPRPANQTMVNGQRPESTAKTRKQSCSPSVTRGRRLEQKQETSNGDTKMGPQRGRPGSQVVGSRMVEKFMNARKGGLEDRELANPKWPDSTAEASAFPNLMPKSWLDMDMKPDRVSYRGGGATATTGRSRASIFRDQ